MTRLLVVALVAVLAMASERTQIDIETQDTFGTFHKEISDIPTMHIPIEWHIPIGCGFSGFYVEFLGLVSSLVPALPELRVTSGPCSEDFFTKQLFPSESVFYRHAYSPWHSLIKAETVDCQPPINEQHLGNAPSAAPLHSTNTNGGSEDDFLWDTNLPGGDLPRSADGIPTRNASVCNCLCVARPACAAWTHRSSDGLCWLKSHPSLPEPASVGLVSRLLTGRHNTGGNKEAEEKEECHEQNSCQSDEPYLQGSSPLPRYQQQEQQRLQRRYPRVDVWHGRCEASEVRTAVEAGRIVVARLMTESASLRNTPGVLDCAMAATEVWTPTAFHAEVFIHAGVPEAKVQVIPEAVDPVLFAPSAAAPLLPPQTWPMLSLQGGVPEVPPAVHVDISNNAAATVPATDPPAEFEFLSVFKWERRKGWDVLLDAYWAAFGPSDPVVLRLRTWKPHWEPGTSDLNVDIERYARQKRRQVPSGPFDRTFSDTIDSSSGGGGGDSASYDRTTTPFRTFQRHELARVDWLGSPDNPHPEALTRAQLLQEYREAHAFVLPTRGEGWGLPVAEAMTLGLPTLVPAWSGPSAYANADNAYLIPLEREQGKPHKRQQEQQQQQQQHDGDDSAVALDYQGYSKPSVPGLSALLRQVVVEYTDGSGRAQAKGAAARAHMIEHFSPQVVGSQVLTRLAVLTNYSENLSFE